MKEFFTTEGRYNRAKYFGYSLVLSVINGILNVIVRGSDSLVPILLVLAVALVLVYVGICITVKRFHDLGRPGTHYFLLLIPFYNIYLGLVLLFKRGEPGMNAYGADPLA